QTSFNVDVGSLWRHDVETTPYWSHFVATLDNIKRLDERRLRNASVLVPAIDPHRPIDLNNLAGWSTGAVHIRRVRHSLEDCQSLTNSEVNAFTHLQIDHIAITEQHLIAIGASNFPPDISLRVPYITLIT